jgi:hypothetical protein
MLGVRRAPRLSEAPRAWRRSASSLSAKSRATGLSGWRRVRGAKASTLRDDEVLLREPGQVYRRGAGESPGRIMAAFGDLAAADVTVSHVTEQAA